MIRTCRSCACAEVAASASKAAAPPIATHRCILFIAFMEVPPKLELLSISPKRDSNQDFAPGQARLFGGEASTCGTEPRPAAEHTLSRLLAGVHLVALAALAEVARPPISRSNGGNGGLDRL